MRFFLGLGFSVALTSLVLWADRVRAVGRIEDPARGERASLDELRKSVRDGKPATRRSAVRELARLGSREAWLLVIEALADPESEVGDAAQLALGGLRDADLVRDLCGAKGLDHKDERVAVRVAEALGRVQVEVDGDELARDLSTRHPEITRYLLWSIERLAEAHRLTGRIERIAAAVARVEASRKDAEMSCAALMALAQLDAARARVLALEALGDREPARRVAALLAAAAMQSPERFSWSVRAASDGDGRVRAQAIESLEDLGTRAAMLALVGLLEREPRLRLRWRIVDALQLSSGLRNRLDPRPWKLWAEQLPEGRVTRPAAAGAADSPGGAQSGTQSVVLVGFPVISDRVCFLFDFSGSMWTPFDDGRTPKEIVDLKLREALEALPEDTWFNLVPFTYDPLPWEKRVQPAKKQVVAKALEFFTGCHAKGRGNFYDAALLALADPDVDTITALTDGVPTGGFHSDMDLIVPLFCERNRFRKVVVDSILVDARLGTARRWYELSRRTGGRCSEVELDQK